MNGATQMQGTQTKRTVSACPLMEYNQKTFLSGRVERKTKCFITYLLTVWLALAVSSLGIFSPPTPDSLHAFVVVVDSAKLCGKESKQRTPLLLILLLNYNYNNVSRLGSLWP